MAGLLTPLGSADSRRRHDRRRVGAVAEAVERRRRAGALPPFGGVAAGFGFTGAGTYSLDPLIGWNPKMPPACRGTGRRGDGPEPPAGEEVVRRSSRPSNHQARRTSRVNQGRRNR